MTEARKTRLNTWVAILERKVATLYGETYVKALKIPEIKQAINANDEEFDWNKYPGAESKLEKLIVNLNKQVNAIVASATSDAYDMGADGADSEVKGLLGKSKVQVKFLNEVCKQAKQQRQEDGLTGWNYIQQKRGGFTLSERVWQSTKQAKQELQIMVQSGIIEGKSADEMSRDVRSQLNDPNKLFRRVRDKETGELRLSKAAQAYHPGAGVYRSSYKNAMRMTRTEVNQGYRVGEQQAYQHSPLVKGYDIMTSNNHTTKDGKGKKVVLKDICDELAGRYPKDFVWSGWHPQCRCKMVPIPLTPEEFGEYMKKKKAGKVSEWKDPSIKKMPKNFQDWVTDRKPQIEMASNKGTLPYFLEDNPYTWKERPVPTPLEIAKMRHESRTEQHTKEIENKWKEHQELQEAVKNLMNELGDSMSYQEAYKEYQEREDRTQRVKEAAERRHALRTPEREEEIKAFWQTKKEEGDKRRRREQIMKNAENRHAQRTKEQEEEIVDKRRKELAQFATWEKYIRDVDARAKRNDWIPDEEKNVWVDGPNGSKNHLRDAYAVAKSLSGRMDVIDYMRPRWNSADAYQSVFGTYRDKLDEARRYIVNGFEKKAVELLDLVDAIRAIEPRYIDLRTYQQAHPPKKKGTKSKIEMALDEADELIKKGDVNGALHKIEDAETTRENNERSRLAKAEEAKRKKEEAERLKAEEEARKKQDVKDFSKAQSAQELLSMVGEDRPTMLEHYEKSVSRNQHVKTEYMENAPEIERKLKDFFKDCDYAHRVPHYLLEEKVDYDGIEGVGLYLRDGITTNLQVNEEGSRLKGRKWSLKTDEYDSDRVAYGHYAFGYQNDKRKVDKSKWLKPNEYYRCGTPVKKDNVQEAWGKGGANGYGDTQIILRKDRVIATFTYGNSLGCDTIPSLVCDPKVCSLDSMYFKNYRDAKYTSMRQIMNSDYGYLELQYLPLKSSGQISPKDWKSVTFPSDPKTLMSKGALDRLYEYGVDVYYADGSGHVLLFKKGKPQITHEEAVVKLNEVKTELDNMFKNEAALSNKDVSIADIKGKMDNGDYIGALEAFDKFKDIEVRKKKLVDLIPDVDEFHKSFTIEELEGAYKAITAKVDYMDNVFKNRNTPDDVLKKWDEEIDKAEHPEKYKSGAKRFSTWEVAKRAYQRKRNKLVYEYHKTQIDDDLRKLRGFDTKDKAFVSKMKEIETNVKAEEWASVEKMITDAQNIMKGLGERVIKLGESSTVKFSEKEFTQAKKDVAKWFKDPDVKKAYKEADDYMSKYAQEMWKGLTDEEKHVLWLYTDGSKYINDEMLGTYSLKCMSPIDGTVRNGLADANIITSIIEKAPALKEAMWMQSGKSAGAFEAMFGMDIRYVSDLSSLVGKEGFNKIFSSCHASSDGFFTKGGSTGTDNPIVMSIYMPEGTKGVYLEPISSYGDNLRWKKGYDWTGNKRREAPSDQVEFLLQRGAKFRITKAYYKDGKWFVDVDLIEQIAVDALDTNIPGLMNRSSRISRKPTLNR